MPADSRLLAKVTQTQIGSVPNIFRLESTSPAALNGLTALQAALLKGSWPWGKNDKIFPAEGAHPYLRDLPDVELHLLDTGHFVLDDNLEMIAPY